MATIVLRGTKGTTLTNAEVDANFSNINTELEAKLNSSSYTAADVLAKLLTVDENGSGLNADTLDGLNSATTNTVSTIVARDSSGNFAAGTITANLSGNASTATSLASTLTIGAGGTGATTAAGARTNLGLVIGTNVQAYDAQLDALASVTAVANSLPYFTAATTAAVTTLSSFGRTLIDDTDAAAARSTLGLAIGTDVQAFDADLSGVASVATNGIYARTGSGTVASRTITQGTGITITNGDGVAGNPTISFNGSNVAITGGSITGITDLDVTDGGTGRSTLTPNAVLLGNGNSAINSLSPGTSGNLLVSNGTSWTSTTLASAVTPGTSGNLLVSNGTEWTSKTLATSGVKLGLGITGEVWNYLTGTRNANETYTNDRTYPIMVTIMMHTGSAPTNPSYIYVDGTIVNRSSSGGWTGATDFTCTTIVPPGKTYSTNSSAANILWVELY